VFKLDPSANETVLYSFCTASKLSTDAQDPFAGLMMDGAGNLCGTTGDGGSGSGAIFKVDTSGNEMVLHRFTGFDGSGPEGGLIIDTAGSLYGTTPFGGASGQAGSGTVFKLELDTLNLTVLHSFTGSDGANPVGDLVMDAAGNLYGTTRGGGSGTSSTCQNSVVNGCGTMFKVDTARNETVLYSFKGGDDGAVPYAGLVMDAAIRRQSAGLGRTAHTGR
jgi:uncharacterized repeat protein (TIGR03803 family)